MKAITIKLPETMEGKLRRYAAGKNQGLSETVRHALQRELETGSDFASIAAPYRGMFRGPRNLSSKEGYGSSQSR
jgi:hypothetical protein